MKKHHVRTWIDEIEGAPGTKRNYARAIQRCLSWCKEEDVIERSPIAKFKKPAGGKRERVITPAEYEKLLSAAGSHEFRDLLMISWETGCLWKVLAMAHLAKKFRVALGTFNVGRVTLRRKVGYVLQCQDHFI